MTLTARMMLILAAPAIMAALTAAHAAEAVKSGEWEFNAQLQGAAMPQLPPGVTLPPGTELGSGGGMKVTHKQCVEPDRAVPSDPRRECKVDSMERKESVITWSTTCKAPQGAIVASAGTARYSGNTMEANLNTRAPNGSGGFFETSQHITGRYLGPCPSR